MILSSYLSINNIPHIAVAAVPHIVVSKYTRENNLLRNALADRSDDFDPYNRGLMELFVEWCVDNDEEAELSKIDTVLGDDSRSYDDLDELHDAVYQEKYTPNPDLVAKFMRTENSNRLYQARIKYEDEGSSERCFDLNNKGKLLPRTTWVGHFTDDAMSIAHQGFKYGEIDAFDLGLTRHKSEKARKRMPGYNFGFEVGDLHKNFQGSSSRRGAKYGDELVLLQTSGVSAYHSGDNEDQVIFYGPHVDWVIPIVPAPNEDYERHDDEDYAVYAKDGSIAYRTHTNVDKSKTAGNYAQQNVSACVDWVIKNFNQNHSRLCWPLPKVQG